MDGKEVDHLQQEVPHPVADQQQQREKMDLQVGEQHRQTRLGSSFHALPDKIRPFKILDDPFVFLTAGRDVILRLWRENIHGHKEDTKTFDEGYPLAIWVGYHAPALPEHTRQSLFVKCFIDRVGQ